MIFNEDVMLYLIKDEFELAYKLSHEQASILRIKYPVVIQIECVNQSILINFKNGWLLNGEQMTLTQLKSALRHYKCPLASSIEFKFDGGTLIVGHVKEYWIDEVLHLYTLFNGQLTISQNQLMIQFGYYQLIKNNNSFDLMIDNCVVAKDVLKSDFAKYLKQQEYKIMADNRLLTIVKNLDEGIDILCKYKQIEVNPAKYIRINNYYSVFYDSKNGWYFKREGDIYWVQSNDKPYLLWRYIRYIFRVEYVESGQYTMHEELEGVLLDEIIIKYLYLVNSKSF